MHGSNLRRSLRLAGYLLTNPSDWYRWTTTSLRPGVTPFELELPWIAYTAIDFLNSFVQPHHAVAEYGGGGSTIFFARRAKTVSCIESDGSWSERIRERVAAIGLQNTQVKTLPYDPANVEGFEASGFLHGIDGGEYDLILVDCEEVSVKVRPFCFRHAEKHVKPGGCIVVDDSWRYPELRESNRANRWQEYRSVGPGRVGVTTTDIFFY